MKGYFVRTPPADRRPITITGYERKFAPDASWDIHSVPITIYSGGDARVQYLVVETLARLDLAICHCKYCPYKCIDVCG